MPVPPKRNRKVGLRWRLRRRVPWSQDSRYRERGWRRPSTDGRHGIGREIRRGGSRHARGGRPGLGHGTRHGHRRGRPGRRALHGRLRQRPGEGRDHAARPSVLHPVEEGARDAGDHLRAQRRHDRDRGREARTAHDPRQGRRHLRPVAGDAHEARVGRDAATSADPHVAPAALHRQGNRRRALRRGTAGAAPAHRRDDPDEHRDGRTPDRRRLSPSRFGSHGKGARRPGRAHGIHRDRARTLAVQRDRQRRSAHALERVRRETPSGTRRSSDHGGRRFDHRPRRRSGESHERRRPDPVLQRPAPPTPARRRLWRAGRRVPAPRRRVDRTRDGPRPNRGGSPERQPRRRRTGDD